MKKLIVAVIITISSCISIHENKVVEKGPNIKLELTRGACYGTCPIYTMSLFKDRQVKYNGKRFVEQQGVYEWYMERTDFKKLEHILRRKEFLKSAEYNLGAQDLPITSLTIYTETDTINIKHKGGIPSNLKQGIIELEQLMIKTANWHQ